MDRTIEGDRASHCARGVPPSGRVYRPHPQGRQASRFADPAADQLRVGDQPQDREDTRSHRVVRATQRRRQGDRVDTVDVRLWHKADIEMTTIDVRFRG